MRIGVFMLLLICLACDRDEEVLAADGTLKTLLDGRARETGNVSAKIYDSSGFEIMDISAEVPEGTEVTRLVLTAYVHNSNDMISTGEYVFSSKLDQGPYDGICFYFLNDGNPPFGTLYVSQSEVGKLTITELDRTGLFVSGTFEAIVGRNNEVKEFTKGSFTKVPLTVN